MNESTEQKAARIFTQYKERLIGEKPPCVSASEIRFCVIQYLCSFPNINPYEMAAAITKDGYKVVYDNSAISPEENARDKARVEKVMKGASL